MKKYCIGCGRELQNTNKKKLGYVVNLDNDYCYRCFRIKNYNDLVQIDDIEESQFEKNISQLILENKKQNRFFYILDVFNLDASRIRSLERILSAEDTTIVVNKVDLLPKSTNYGKILEYVEEMFNFGDLKDVEIVLFSSVKNWGIDELVESLEDQENNYFIGKTNVGKSSIINSILKSVGETPKIVESYFLNTTIDTIEIQYSENMKIIDTPGIAETNSFSDIVEQKDLKYLFFKKEVKQLSYRIDKKQSFAYGNIFGLNLELSGERDVHFYVNPTVDFHRTKSDNFRDYILKNFDELHPSLIEETEYEEIFITIDDDLIGRKVDVFIQDLGWASFNLKRDDKVSYFLPKNTIKPLVELRNSLI
ncbi:ribosome biogenesis GTPase YqeH [Mesoplasma lactucae]|nr:ribosome biogenesis GTPase YqeH [Mesoplasma lactucae]ATZ20141.1 GTP-binding protein YqeH [Mesoplasma lactucae ATCC 49193]MCL8216889.1 putative protein YqeH [Mesoplasma lactucae ATCC 49193]